MGRLRGIQLALLWLLHAALTIGVVHAEGPSDYADPDSATVSQILADRLSSRLSSDDTAFSNVATLSVGNRAMALPSVGVTSYVGSSGTQAVLDSMRVSLSLPVATILVPGNYSTIQAAINAASPGDIIEVAPGTYSGPGNQDIDFRGKAITVRSAGGPRNTTISCAAGHRGFHFQGGEGLNSVLSGFTIQGQQPAITVASGGGIYCQSSSPTISECIITGFSAAKGGGIAVIGPSDATITNCIIQDNSASIQGGGIYCWGNAATITGCRIAHNTGPANLDGGGAYCGGSTTDVFFQNCIFSGNTARAGRARNCPSSSGDRPRTGQPGESVLAVGNPNSR